MLKHLKRVTVHTDGDSVKKQQDTEQDTELE